LIATSACGTLGSAQSHGRPDIYKNTFLVAFNATTYIYPADRSLETPTSESDIEVRKKRGRSPCLV
jgi:hypothetical protein